MAGARHLVAKPGPYYRNGVPIARGHCCGSASVGQREFDDRRADYAGANKRFRLALYSYGLKYGLPNLSRDDILAKIEAEDHALANRIEGELHMRSSLPRMDEQ